MRLKDLLLIIGSCYCTSVIAQNTVNSLPWKSSIEPKLHQVESPVYDGISSSRTKTLKKMEATTAEVTSPWINIDVKEAKAPAENGKMKLDSIVGTNPDGSKYTRQLFTYNDQNIIEERINSYWNATTRSWDTAQEYKFEWDEDGYVTMQYAKAYGQGQRFEYTYNEQKLGIEQITYELNGNDEWVKTQKGEYKYDDKGNMIDEMLYIWSGNEWVKYCHNSATWDDNNWQTSILSMSWNGNEWTGETKEDYVWYAKDKLSYKGMWLWLDDTKEWRLVQKWLQEFNQAGQCTAQKMRYWNEDRKDWSGEYASWGPSAGEPLSYDAIITYDELGRTTLQQHKECRNNSAEWFVASEMITQWTDGLENGDYESEMNAYLYDYDTKKKMWNQHECARYNAQGLQTWILNQMQNLEGTEMLDNYEEKFAYDDRGNLTYSASWDWVDGVRKPSVEENNTYDADNNIIESYYRGSSLKPFGSAQKAPGHESQDDEGWNNVSHFIYKYENGLRTEKLKWQWNGSDWTTSIGEGLKYDWNVTSDRLITMHGFGSPYKIDFAYNHTGDGANGWLTITNTYHYTDELTSIQQTKSGNVTFNNNLLKVTGGNKIENSIYETTGKLVYQGNSSEENLEHLGKGVYIVKSMINGKASTLKIVIM